MRKEQLEEKTIHNSEQEQEGKGRHTRPDTLTHITHTRPTGKRKQYSSSSSNNVDGRKCFKLVRFEKRKDTHDTQDCKHTMGSRVVGKPNPISAESEIEVERKEESTRKLRWRMKRWRKQREGESMMFSLHADPVQNVHTEKGCRFSSSLSCFCACVSSDSLCLSMTLYVLCMGRSRRDRDTTDTHHRDTDSHTCRIRFLTLDGKRQGATEGSEEGTQSPKRRLFYLSSSRSHKSSRGFAARFERENSLQRHLRTVLQFPFC